MGSENRTFKRIWVCFIPQPAGTVPWLSFWDSLCFFPIRMLFHLLALTFPPSIQDAQSSINDLSGKTASFYSIHILSSLITVLFCFSINWFYSHYLKSRSKPATKHKVSQKIEPNQASPNIRDAYRHPSKLLF